MFVQAETSDFEFNGSGSGYIKRYNNNMYKYSLSKYDLLQN